MKNSWAPLYYGTHTGVEGDLQFYLRSLKSESKVLDLGCGCGRLTLPLVNASHRVTAVDISEYGLHQLRTRAASYLQTKQLQILQADFRALSLEVQFDAVILSFNAFLCLRADERSRFLSRISDLLAPGGLFLFDLYDGAEFFDDAVIADNDESNEPWVSGPEYVSSVECDGVDFDVYQSGVFDPRAALITMNYTHFESNSEEPSTELDYEITHHLVSFDELKTSLVMHGFEVLEVIEAQFEGSTHGFFNVRSTKSNR
ncbi:MAG: SAM-dependent methyltransferase [Bradymonadia bacterium]